MMSSSRKTTGRSVALSLCLLISHHRCQIALATALSKIRTSNGLISADHVLIFLEPCGFYYTDHVLIPLQFYLDCLFQNVVLEVLPKVVGFGHNLYFLLAPRFLLVPCKAFVRSEFFPLRFYSGCGFTKIPNK